MDYNIIGNIINIIKNSVCIELISDRGNKLPWKRRLCVYASLSLPYIGAVIMVALNPNGFEDTFISLLVSVLSIIVGVFIAVLIFVVESFPVIKTDYSKVFKLSLLQEKNEEPKDYNISIEEINNESTKQKDWRSKSSYYLRRIIGTLSRNVCLSILALIFLLFYMFAPIYWGISLDSYEMCKLEEIDVMSVRLFLHLALAGGIRFLILSFTLSVLVYTFRLISDIFRYLEARDKYHAALTKTE